MAQLHGRAEDHVLLLTSKRCAGMHTRAVLVHQVFLKTLCLSPAEWNHFSSGVPPGSLSWRLQQAAVVSALSCICKLQGTSLWQAARSNCRMHSLA